MLRVFAPDRRIVLLVSALVLIALSILYFKVHVLKFTLLPSPETESCRVPFGVAISAGLLLNLLLQLFYSMEVA